MNKKTLFLFICFAVTIPSVSAFGACTKLSSKYVACKPGYYLSPRALGGCIKCPVAGQDTNGNDVYGITADHNTGSITSCQMPNAKYQDTQGYFEVNGHCPYTN